MKSISTVALLMVSLAVWLQCGICDLSCTKHSPCTCEGNNFTKVDVQAVMEKHSKMAIPDSGSNKNKYEYLVNFCKGRTCANDELGGKNSVACQKQIDGKQNISSKLGDISDYAWQVFGNNTFAIKFDQGDPANDGSRSAMVYIYVYNKSEDGITFDKLKFEEERKDDGGEGKTAHVYTFSINITPNEENKGAGGGGGTVAGIIGLVLIFLAIAALIAYFIIGTIILYVVKGARGVEAIPNYTFWMTLPFLIKDGFMFTISPCLKLAGHGKTSYQSL